MRQVTSKVISNEKLLGELERPDARTFNRPEARNTLGSWLMWLRCPGIAQESKPGQFAMVRCGEECLLPRPFSIHRVNDKSEIALFFAVWADGKGTEWLSQRKKNDAVELFGPLGNNFTLKPWTSKVLLVAGGMGIAPLLFLANQALKDGLSVKLLRGASGEYKPSGKPNPSQHYSEELLPRGIEDVKTITTSPDGREKMVLDLLPNFADWADQVFACGPMAMYRDTAKRKKELGLLGKPVQISLEMSMGCGRGLCYACTVKTKTGLKQVCKDGPVFELDDIIWDELAQT